jgi:hypothetical protein
MTPDLCKAFRRNADGSWTCIAQTVLTLGAGQMVTIVEGRTVRPGELLGNYDLVAYLELTCAQNHETER